VGTVEAIRNLLHEAGETHHLVWRLVDGHDPNWASWYADWLLEHSELPEVLGQAPVRSELVYMLVKLGKEHAEQGREDPWEDYYAEALAAYFSAGGDGVSA
jgi:hypothetical protein